jgi:hypothetical protein
VLLRNWQPWNFCSELPRHLPSRRHARLSG